LHECENPVVCEFLTRGEAKAAESMS